MDIANKLAALATRAANSNAVINACLGTSFALLCVRSVNQQKNIEALEAEKESLIQSNKAMKTAIWDWKQQLYAEAASDSALVPLARLKAIYGDASAPQTGNAVKEDAKSLASKFMV